MAKGVSTARRVAYAVCLEFRMTLRELTDAPKSRRMNLARGVYCLVCDKEGVHPIFSCKVLKRSRSNVINIARRYRGYRDTGYKEVAMCYDKVMLDLY